MATPAVGTTLPGPPFGCAPEMPTNTTSVLTLFEDARDAAARRRCQISDGGRRRERARDGHDLRRGEVVEVARRRRIVLRHVRVGIIVEKRVEREVVQVRERVRAAGVPPVCAREVVQVQAAHAVVRVDHVFVAEIEVVDVARVRQVAVVAEDVGVRQRQVVDAVRKRVLAGEERRVRRHRGRGAVRCASDAGSCGTVSMNAGRRGTARFSRGGAASALTDGLTAAGGSVCPAPEQPASIAANTAMGVKKRTREKTMARCNAAAGRGAPGMRCNVSATTRDGLLGAQVPCSRRSA